MNQEGSNQRRRSSPIALAAIGGTLVWFLVVWSYAKMFDGGFSQKQDHWGQFGDFVGGLLNPVFAFAGFVVLLVTLREQRKQIESQRQELEKEKHSRKVREFET